MSSKLLYRCDDQVESTELFDLLDRMMAYEGDRFPAKKVFHVDLRTAEKEAISLQHTISITAREEDGRMVGYLRILCDQVYIFYILDVMVDPACRRQGIGHQLVRRAVDYAKERGFIKVFLTAIPGSEPFYKQFGFKEGLSPVLTLRGEDYQ